MGSFSSPATHQPAVQPCCQQLRPNQELQLSKNLQGKDLFWWKLQLRPEGCEGPVKESKGQGNPLAGQKPNPKPLMWPGSLWLGGPCPPHLPTAWPHHHPCLLLVGHQVCLGMLHGSGDSDRAGMSPSGCSVCGGFSPPAASPPDPTAVPGDAEWCPLSSTTPGCPSPAACDELLQPLPCPPQLL